MNKLILISLVIFFTICSKSWAEGLIGKGLICEGIGQPWHPQVWFFDDGYIFHIDFDDSRKEGTFVNQKTNYITNAKFIIWSTVVADSKYKLNRKTLKLELSQWDNNNFQEVYFYYQCRITNWAGIEEFFKPQMDKLKEDLKKNKI
tara:strand:+ start:443 stop:880 length:438 start_codon:yes stop_codon:yes gene_type:complete